MEGADYEAAVKAIDSVSGEIQWEFGTEFAPDRGREVLRTSGHLLLREDDLVHLVDPRTGEAVSTFEMVSSGLVVYEGDFLYLVDEEYLRAVCPQVLQMVWKTELEDIVSEASGDDIEIFSDSDAKVLLGSEEEFSVLTKEDGRVLYSCEHDGSAKPLLLEEDKVFLAYSPEREMPAREGYMILVGPEK